MHGFASTGATCGIDVVLVCLFFSKKHYRHVINKSNKYTRGLRRLFRALHYSLKGGDTSDPLTSHSFIEQLGTVYIWDCLSALLEKCQADSISIHVVDTAIYDSISDGVPSSPVLFVRVLRRTRPIHYGFINLWKRVTLMIHGKRYILNGVVCCRNSKYMGYIWDAPSTRWLFYNPCESPAMLSCHSTEATGCKASRYGELFFYTIYS